MGMGNLFDFPLIKTLVGISYSTRFQYFAFVDGDWTDLVSSDAKLRVRICSKNHVRIQSNAFIPNFCMDILILLSTGMSFLPKSLFCVFNLAGYFLFIPNFCMDISFFGPSRQPFLPRLVLTSIHIRLELIRTNLVGFCIHFFLGIIFFDYI